MELLPHQIEAIEKFKDVRACLIGDKMGASKTDAILISCVDKCPS